MRTTALIAFVVVACTPAPAQAPRHATMQTGELEHEMANCPSALPSAITSVEDIDDGIAVTIKVTNPMWRDRLLELAHVHARIGGPESSVAEHTGRHGGPGVIGHCPILHAGTRVSFEPIPDGVRFSVFALPGRDLAGLRRETRERAASLPQFADR